MVPVAEEEHMAETVDIEQQLKDQLLRAASPEEVELIEQKLDVLRKQRA